MKTNTTKGIFLFAIMPAIIGLLLSACGDGGGGSNKLNQSNISIGLQDYEITYPRNGDKNVCTNVTVQILMKGEGCSVSDISSAVSVYDVGLGADHPLALNPGTPHQTASGCRYDITVKQSAGNQISGQKRYGVGVYSQPNASVKTLLPNTIEFTTGSANMVDCGDGSRFVVENIFGAPRGQSTDIDRIGTYDDNGDYNFDVSDLLRVGFRGISSSIINTILGTGTLQNNKQSIFVKFNEPPNVKTLTAIKVMTLDLSFKPASAVAGISVAPSSDDPYTIEVKAPARGYPTPTDVSSPNLNYALYIGPVLSLSGKVLSQAGASTAKAYVTFFGVGYESELALQKK